MHAPHGMNPIFDGNWLRDGQMVITIANTDATDRLKVAGGYKEIPSERLGTDLSAFYAAGFRPSP
jgi:hypothetical protein